MKRLLPLLLLSGCALAPVKTPDELAVYTKCDPERIAYWIGNKIEYHEQGPYWLPAEASMTLGRGDCKARAQVAKDTLNRCVNYDPRIQILKGEGKRYHAVTLFTNPSGERGFIDGPTYSLFPKAYPWTEIVKEIKGGPWEAQ